MHSHTRKITHAQTHEHTHALSHMEYAHSYACVHALIMRVFMRGGGLGSRPKNMYGETLGDGVEYHLMKPTPRR